MPEDDNSLCLKLIRAVYYRNATGLIETVVKIMEQYGLEVPQDLITKIPTHGSHQQHRELNRP